MTVLDDRHPADWTGACARPALRPRVQYRPAQYRPAPVRPMVAPLQYRAGGVRMSQAVHTRRPVSTTVSFGLAGVAALITLWLGFIGHFSGDRAAAATTPADQLAVVQVRAGETLQQLAARIAPEASTAEVVQRIRDLNELDSASVDAGQTLIAPVG